MLFADPDVIEESVERFSRPNPAALTRILDEDRRSGRLQAVETQMAIPAMLGACVFFFLGSPIGSRLQGFDAMDEKLSRKFAEKTAEMILFGIARREGTRS